MSDLTESEELRAEAHALAYDLRRAGLHDDARLIRATIRLHRAVERLQKYEDRELRKQVAAAKSLLAAAKGAA